MGMALSMLLAFGLSVAQTQPQAQAQTQTQMPTKAQQPSKLLVQTYTGMLKVTADKSGRITDAKLNVGSLVPRYYTIALDKAGKELAGKMNGKRVQVKGTLERRSRATVLVVRQFSPIIYKPKTTIVPKPADNAAEARRDGSLPIGGDANVQNSPAYPAPATRR